MNHKVLCCSVLTSHNDVNINAPHVDLKHINDNRNNIQNIVVELAVGLFITLLSLLSNRYFMYLHLRDGSVELSKKGGRWSMDSCYINEYRNTNKCPQ